MPRDPSEYGGDTPPDVMNPGPQPTGPGSVPSDDPSVYGGDTPPGTMDPGPQPAPEEDQTPEPDDASKDGSGGA